MKESDSWKLNLKQKITVIESLKQELNYVREQMVLYKKTFYGSRSEKIEIPDQLTLNLFNEAETESTVLKTEPELQVRVTSHSRKKSKKRGIEDLPETVVEHDLEDKTDPQTGKPLRLIGTNERKELVHHKEYYEVIKHIQYVYSGSMMKKLKQHQCTKVICLKQSYLKVLLHHHCSHRYLIKKLQSFFAIIQTEKHLNA